jgi:hypothetical protein
MDTITGHPRGRRQAARSSTLATPVALATLATLATLLAPAAAQGPPAPAVITAFAGHAVVAGRGFDDLDALEAALRPARPSAIRLEACGAGVTDTVKAIVHRLGQVPMELRALADDDPACAVNGRQYRPGGSPARMGLAGVDHGAVERHWRALAP